MSEAAPTAPCMFCGKTYPELEMVKGSEYKPICVHCTSATSLYVASVLHDLTVGKEVPCHLGN